MDKKTREELKALLLQKRDELLGVGEEKLEPNRVDATSVPDEDTQPLNEMSQVISSRNNRARGAQLEAIDRSLQMIAENPDEYGLCSECEEPIKIGRLRLMPWTSFCVECQAEYNDEQRGGRRRHIFDYKQ